MNIQDAGPGVFALCVVLILGPFAAFDGYPIAQLVGFYAGLILSAVLVYRIDKVINPRRTHERTDGEGH